MSESSGMRRHGSKSLIGILCWVVPSSVLLVAGVGKIWNPQAHGPAAIGEKLGIENWSMPFVILGSCEVAVAALTIMPLTRRLGLTLASVLLAAFSIVIALDARDAAFINNCGCFGATASFLPSQGGHSSVDVLLLRNLAITLIAVLGARAEHGSVLIAGNVSSALVATAILALSVFYIKERSANRLLEASVASADRGQAFLRDPSSGLPNFRMITPSGRATTASQHLKGGDQLVVFSCQCSHCIDAAALWPATEALLRARGSRLVLLSTPDDNIERVRSFLSEQGCSELAWFVLSTLADQRRIGVVGIPHVIELDQDRIPIGRTANSVTRAIAELERQFPMLAPEIVEGVARRMLGSSVRVADMAIAPGRLISAKLQTLDETLRFYVVEPRTGAKRHRSYAMLVAPNSELIGMTELSRIRLDGPVSRRALCVRGGYRISSGLPDESSLSVYVDDPSTAVAAIAEIRELELAAISGPVR